MLSAQAPSDAIGVFKEELDAGGGSGFSFGDLLADRAGTTFALLATRDDAAARALQGRLDAGFRVDDFFPEAADLPENIQAAELEARYGGWEGACFASMRRRSSGASGVARPTGPWRPPRSAERRAPLAGEESACSESGGSPGLPGFTLLLIVSFRTRHARQFGCRL